MYILIYNKEKKSKISKIRVIRIKKRWVKDNSHIIYCIYLADIKKLICIKDLKIVKNTNKKANSQLNFYSVIVIQNDIRKNIFLFFLYSLTLHPFLHSSKI